MTNLTILVSLMLGTQQLQCGGSDIGKTVRDSLFNEVVRQDRAADAAWLACDTKEKLAEHQAWVRAGVLNAIGGLPEKVAKMFSLVASRRGRPWLGSALRQTR